jgi:hypothetical protein
VRDQLVRDARSDLCDRAGAHERVDVWPRRRVSVGVENASRSVAPGGVDEDGVVPGGRVPDCVGDVDGADEPECCEIGPGDRRRHGVGVDAGDPQARPGERDQVGSDSAAQIQDGGAAGRRDPGRAPRRDGRVGGLLKAVGGEVHGCGVGAELLDGSPAQPHLRHRGRDVGRPMPGVPQALGDGEVGRRGRAR